MPAATSANADTFSLADSEWQEFSLDLTSFDGCNLEALQAIIFSAGLAAGEFSFQIDEVSFQ